MSVTHAATGLTLLVVVLTCATSAAPQTRLGSVKSLQCSLQRQSTGTWLRDGTTEATVKPATLTLHFESIDSDASTAILRNGAMTTEVTVRLVEGYLHLMQAFRTGPLYTTTVFEAGAVGRRFKVVHSRHEYFTTPLPGATSSPEQYYGACEVVQ
jgi:hypothetical protein